MLILYVYLFLVTFQKVEFCLFLRRSYHQFYVQFANLNYRKNWFPSWFFGIYMIKLSRKTYCIFLHAPIHMKMITFQEMSFKLTEYLQHWKENGFVPFFCQIDQKMLISYLVIWNINHSITSISRTNHPIRNITVQKKITDHTLGWAFDSIFFFFFIFK